MVEGKGFVEPGPLALNEVLDSSPGDYSRPSAKACSGGGIILGSAVPDASGGSLKWNRSDAGSTSTETLDNNLCSPTPTPVLVVVKNPTSGHDHYVVVTGKTSTGYSIIDPGYLGRTDLSSHGNVFKVAGVVQSVSGDDPGELDFSIVDTATLLVTAPDGSRTGFDPTTGQVVRDVPQSVYYADSAGTTDDSDQNSDPPFSTTYSVQSFRPLDGVYVVQVTGLQAGAYQLGIKSFDANGRAQNFVLKAGIAAPGSVRTLTVQYSSQLGATTTASLSATYASTLEDILNSQQLGLIDRRGIAASLGRKVERAARAATQRDFDEALERLKEFKEEVQNLSGKHVRGVASQVLLDDANSLISQIPSRRKHDEPDRDRGKDK